MIRLIIILLLVLVIVFLIRRALEIWKSARSMEEPVVGTAMLEPGNHTVEDRLAQIGDAARSRLQPFFSRANMEYPPREIVLIAFKEEKILDLMASGPDGRFQLLKSYPVLAASGGTGPKLREGDMQVPEGFYEVELLNPNSRFHLSLRLNYPSPTDLLRAGEDDRDPESLGSDIMIHGRAVSTGCLAMGDPAIEELFTLAADTGLENIRVILAPRDLRAGKTPALQPGFPPWVADLHDEILRELQKFPGPANAYR
jgi:murein L,D-transpeptidase YafK